ncbi:MAG TPA: hypothetical protein VMW70_03875 [Burkholderiales bacterium]|nr:hypothetical protein [Burkholderiales bacterium]
MKTLCRVVVLFAAIAMLGTSALAGALDKCPDPEAARKWVKACMQENPYNTRESCEQRALEKFCKEQ